MNKKIKYSRNIGIIGSSPLLLMVAIYLAKRGKNVIVIDKCSSVGGCWKLILEEGIYTEDACHLLESYNKSYKFITTKMQIPLTTFYPDKYPVKVIENNSIKIVKYHRKLSIIHEVIRKILSSVKMTTKSAAFAISLNATAAKKNLYHLKQSLMYAAIMLLRSLKHFWM